MGFTRDSQGRALVGGLPLCTLLSHPPIATPFYVYDLDAMVKEAHALSQGYGPRSHLLCYAAKANTAGRILRRFAHQGLGADVVSGAELAVCLGAGMVPDRIVWSGVAKTDDEIDQALHAGDHGILAIQIESLEEVERVAARATTLQRSARISIRINPGVEADTHAHVATGHDEAKFGVLASDASKAFDALRSHPSLRLVGLSMHIGSQLTSVEPYAQAGRVLCGLGRAWLDRGGQLDFLDFGGGFGIDYGYGCNVSPADFARAACALTEAHGLAHLRILAEPGRSLVASHGVLVTHVIQTKRWNRHDTAGWVFLDAGMNVLLRPALYGSHHRIEPLTLSDTNRPWRVAGPICESSDDFGTHLLPYPVPDALVIRDVGAYGYTMASVYNGRALPTEVFLEGGTVRSVSHGSDITTWIRNRLAM